MKHASSSAPIMQAITQTLIAITLLIVVLGMGAALVTPFISMGLALWGY